MALMGGDHDPPVMETRRWASVATLGLLLAALCALPAPLRAAQPNQLASPSVSPGAGTTATTFVFSVRYEGRDPATSVVAIVAGQTVNLALVSGTTSSGVWSGGAQLPAGNWAVNFSAVATRGNDPTTGGGTVQVAAPTPVPTPVPPPTAAPTPPPVVAPPAPTPPPAGGPAGAAPATPAPLPAPIGGQEPPAGTTASGAPGGPLPSSQDAVAGTAGGGVFSPAPNAVPIGGTGVVSTLPGRMDWLGPVMLGGLGVIALVAAWGLLIGARDRRRRKAEQAALVAAMPHIGPAAADAEKARAAAVWELDAQLEEETIGTVDFLPLGKDDAAEEAATVLPAAAPAKRVSPRVARLEAARTRRPSSARRRLLEGDEGVGSA